MVYKNKINALHALIVLMPLIPSVGLHAQEAESAIEEVVVYSIRQSLESALAEKRQKTNLTEIINADDIGKLPDENVAEVLENIPGVQITRSGGIGEGVSIRGSDQNRVEINGRGTTPSGDQRGGISFADLPAALVRSLNVVKVPTADMVEGSLGGTINVKTYRGLKLKKPLRVVRYQSEYAQNAQHWNANYSTTLGNKFSTDYGDIGAILTLSHIDKTVREDGLRVSPSVRRVTGNPQSSLDLDGDGDFDPYYTPGFGDTVYGLEDRENSALSGSVEWRVSPSLKLFFEGSYTDFERRGRQQQSFLGTPNSDKELDGLDDATFDVITVAGVQVPIMTSGIIGGGIINGRPDEITDTALPNDGLQLKMGNRSDSRHTASYVSAFGGEWANDEWLVEFEVTGAKSDTESLAFTTTFQFNDPNSANFHSSGARLRVPFAYDIRDGTLSFGPAPGAANVENLLDPNYYSLFIARDIQTTFDNEEFTQKIDLTWSPDHPFLTDLKFGVRTSQRVNQRTKKSESTPNFPGLSGADLSSYLIPTPGDFFAFNSGGSYLDNFLTADAREVYARRDELRETLGLAVNGIVDPLQGFQVDEDTYAAYLRADFDGEILGVPARGNVGIRMIDTDQLASGNEVLGDGSLNAVSERQKYTNWLPSASLVLSPIEKFQVRLGYAKILRRPNFSQLSPTVAYPLNEAQAVRVGDPSLRPTMADQYDLTLEYYFRKGSVLSLGYYYKDLESVIGSELRYLAICNPRAVGDLSNAPCITADGLPGVRVNRISPVNLSGGEIQGFEIGLQHNFKDLPRPFDALGMIANYAFQDGKRDDTFGVPGFLQDDGVTDADFPLNFRGLSESSYNFTLYFERPRYRWSGRLRYTYRDGFLKSESEDVSNSQPLYQDSRGQLNASVSYRIDDIFTFTFSGVNLTKQQATQRAAFPEGPIVRQRDADRRLAFGLRARF
ncbi:MAG: TonB-dependent receptor [Pseudomonadales bacterium]